LLKPVQILLCENCIYDFVKLAGERKHKIKGIKNDTAHVNPG